MKRDPEANCVGSSGRTGASVLLLLTEYTAAVNDRIRILRVARFLLGLPGKFSCSTSLAPFAPQLHNFTNGEVSHHKAEVSKRPSNRHASSVRYLALVSKLL